MAHSEPKWQYPVTPCNPPEVFCWEPEIDWATARDLDRTVYFTGKPCKHGHIAERWVGNRSCAQCMRQRQRSDGHHQRIAYRRVTDPAFAKGERERHRAEYAVARENPTWMANCAEYSRQYRAARKAG